MPNTTYSQKPDPTRRMRPDLPRVLYDACGRKGHSANTCDFLAMSVFLQRYLKNGIATKDTIAAGMVHAWVGQKLLNCFIFKSFSLSVIAS
jgi:hypothetical protein